jgi:hypothetical protein
VQLVVSLFVPLLLASSKLRKTQAFFALLSAYIFYLYIELALGGRVVYHQLFPLKTMLEFLCPAVEQHFPVVQVIHLPISP